MNRGSGAQSWQENAGVDWAGRLKTGKSFALQGAEKTDWNRREWLEVFAVSRYAKFQTNRFPGGTLITRKMTQKLSYGRAQTLTANKEGHHYISENNLRDSCDTTALKHNELCHSGQVQRGQLSRKQSFLENSANLAVPPEMEKRSDRGKKPKPSPTRS